jgi:hypothetical protein
MLYLAHSAGNRQSLGKRAEFMATYLEFCLRLKRSSLNPHLSQFSHCLNCCIVPKSCSNFQRTKQRPQLVSRWLLSVSLPDRIPLWDFLKIFPPCFLLSFSLSPRVLVLFLANWGEISCLWLYWNKDLREVELR